MEVQYTENTTTEENYKGEEYIKEDHLEWLILYGSDNSHFVAIKTNLDNKTTCGSDS